MEAREKIDPNAFLELNEYITDTIYNECDDIELWNGYRLSAIDGSVFEIPDTELIRNEFGAAKNQNRKVARARTSCIFDILNNIVIKSKIGRYDIGERVTAKEMIEELINENKSKNDLILFDRGYPKAELFAYLIDNDINFLMRAARNYSKQIINAKKEDQIITLKFRGKTYKLRVLRFLLSSGQEEILITSLTDKKYIVENFTSKSKIAIEQYFYATIYLVNMAELARKQSDDIIETRNKGKENKYEYKTNTNILIGTLKEEFILLLLETNKRKRNKKFKQILNTIAQSTVRIRPNRQNKKIKRRPRGKYKTNQKRCL